MSVCVCVRVTDREREKERERERERENKRERERENDHVVLISSLQEVNALLPSSRQVTRSSEKSDYEVQ